MSNHKVNESTACFQTLYDEHKSDQESPTSTDARDAYVSITENDRVDPYTQAVQQGIERRHGYHQRQNWAQITIKQIDTAFDQMKSVSVPDLNFDVLKLTQRTELKRNDPTPLSAALNILNENWP
jgi:hypothetical protein